MRVRTALQIINQSLDEPLSEAEGDVDPHTRFALTWFEQRGMQDGSLRRGRERRHRPGLQGRRRKRVPRPARVLPPHLPHRGPPSPPRQRPQTALRSWRAKRYWYSTQASVTRRAQDRAEGYEEDDVNAEIVRRLRAEKNRGEFAGVHIAPDGSSDVPDEKEARLVILGPDDQHTGRGKNSPALRTAGQTLEARGSSPRKRITYEQ